MKKLFLMGLLTLATLSPAWAWEHWETFKDISVEKGRVIDYSDARRVTTSEGQSYAMFFALVANDQKAFKALLDWTQANLAQGDLTKTLPSWLWGKDRQTWGILDTNNAMDSDMWIAYCLLEAGRLWQREDYTKLGLAMMQLMKTQVRDVDSLGSVLLPGRVGFESKESVKLNPSYYPLFILKRFAEEDAYWNDVYDGSLRMLLRSSPSGIAPDWASFTRKGELIATQEADNTIGSYNAIRVYLWAGMMSAKDPAYQQLKAHFAPMIEVAEKLNAAPEKIDVNTLKINRAGPKGFVASMLPLMKDRANAALMRTILLNDGLQKDSYYSNVLTLYGLGFEQNLFAFDENGYLYFPRQGAQK